MLITNKELIEMDACSCGLYRFIEQTNNTDEPVEVVSLIGGENTIWDLLWLAGKKVPDFSLQNIARDCALFSIEQIKPHLTDDLYTVILDHITNDRHSDNDWFSEKLCTVIKPLDNDYFAFGIVVMNFLCRRYHSAVIMANKTTKGKEKINQLLVKLFS